MTGNRKRKGKEDDDDEEEKEEEEKCLIWWRIKTKRKLADIEKSRKKEKS